MYFEIGDFVRIERSPYINGHFYLRFRKNSNQNIDDINDTNTVAIDEVAIGFGYDEVFRDKNIFLSNDLVANIRIFATSIVPVADKWIIYHNDFPRNKKFLPNTFHILTNWIPLSIKTCNIINNLLHNNLDDISFLFKLPFSSITKENITNNCRTILLNVIEDSIDNIELLYSYFHGNPLNNDLIHGCLIFNCENRHIKKIANHPCIYLQSSYCCKCVKKNPNSLVKRVPVINENCAN